MIGATLTNPNFDKCITTNHGTRQGPPWRLFLLARWALNIWSIAIHRAQLRTEAVLAWSNALIVESRSLYQYTRCAHILFIYFRGGSVLDDRMLGGRSRVDMMTEPGTTSLRRELDNGTVSREP
jgi:hypothetical protein